MFKIKLLKNETVKNENCKKCSETVKNCNCQKMFRLANRKPHSSEDAACQAEVQLAHGCRRIQWVQSKLFILIIEFFYGTVGAA